MNLHERVVGLPTARDEAWKYTRPASFLGPAWSSPEPPSLVVADGADEVFVDGYRQGAPAPGEPVGGGVGFDGLNLAFARDGLRWAVPAGGEGAREVLCWATGGSRLAAVRHAVSLGAGARGLLVERYASAGAAFTSTHLQVALDEGAELVHVRWVEEAADAVHHGAIDVRVAPGARYRLVSLVLGGQTVRVEPTVALLGRGAHADLHGLLALRGAQHADHHVTVDHAAPGGVSRQAFRSLLEGRSRGVYTGRVQVRPGADGTDSGQIHRALLLSDDAVANARPQLEIEADDVKCAHGAAVGTLDQEALFYLRQRGLDLPQARAVLTAGFIGETLAAIPAGPARERADRVFDRWVAG